MTIFSPTTLPAVATRKSICRTAFEAAAGSSASSSPSPSPSSSRGLAGGVRPIEPATSAEKLPSCGLRFSVMSRSASTLKMLTTESPVARLKGVVGSRMPSMRKRTIISFLVGSRWMSVARLCRASWIISRAAR